MKRLNSSSALYTDSQLEHRVALAESGLSSTMTQDRSEKARKGKQHHSKQKIYNMDPDGVDGNNSEEEKMNKEEEYINSRQQRDATTTNSTTSGMSPRPFESRIVGEEEQADEKDDNYISAPKFRYYHSFSSAEEETEDAKKGINMRGKQAMAIETSLPYEDQDSGAVSSSSSSSSPSSHLSTSPKSSLLTAAGELQKDVNRSGDTEDAQEPFILHPKPDNIFASPVRPSSRPKEEDTPSSPITTRSNRKPSQQEEQEQQQYKSGSKADLNTSNSSTKHYHPPHHHNSFSLSSISSKLLDSTSIMGKTTSSSSSSSSSSRKDAVFLKFAVQENMDDLRNMVRYINIFNIYIYMYVYGTSFKYKPKTCLISTFMLEFTKSQIYDMSKRIKEMEVDIKQKAKLQSAKDTAQVCIKRSACFPFLTRSLTSLFSLVSFIMCRTYRMKF